MKNSQEAHEAIRPTDISTTPKHAKLSGDEEKLYMLIWNRTVASQMESARYERKTLIINSQNKSLEFRASSRKNLFKGFEILTGSEDNEVANFPEGLVTGKELTLVSNKYEQKFTTPPNRLSLIHI